MEFIQELLNDGNEELVLDRGQVERSIVHAKPLGAILLLDK
jgi:hypothetical protein